MLREDLNTFNLKFLFSLDNLNKYNLMESINQTAVLHKIL